ncbi:pyrethroid hydrolase Ces2a [Lucilia cuprina]|uniref:pyrethroid hydrolase Ces2a n=1 Tax=Lucilia cuprina TaxID=7375 RepID=UPI000C71BB89|nr:pyrethroid hydrolase Ces2a [Lucilia cuprina]KAI8122538.1 Acetylcholinesterase [Lucilia cuprina]
MDTKCYFSILNKLILLGLIFTSRAQQTHINLKQGTLVGLKVFPDSARSAVYAFLGVPYAEPPIEELRFSPPKPHRGWNRTLVAMTMRPICPQLSNTIYDEAATEDILARPSETNEDCLYLNIWVSENGLRYGNLPVLVILTGEDMSYDWPRNRITGLDIAAEGFVVITVQYRTNIFGWLNVPGNSELSGNYGLQDQFLALKWIEENIKNFGGNLNQITLLGHGTSGAPCAFYHSLLNNGMLYSSSLPFNQLILMSSGNIEDALQPVALVQEASKVIVKKLGCQFEEYSRQLVQCLRSKSVSDMLKAFESVYDHGNGTYKLGPTLNINLKDILYNSTIINSFPPSIIGITSNEGAFMQDYWLELSRDSYSSLKTYINYTLLRNVLPGQSQNNNNSSSNHALEALNWRYFNDNLEENPIHLLAALQRFVSEYKYEIPFYTLLSVLSNATVSQNNNKLYAYINHFTNAMDIRGKINFFGGSSHTSDLPLLFGPTLFQQISRRRLNIEEEKLYRKMRTPFINFIKNGNPTPGRVYDGWVPYTNKNKYIYDLGDIWSPATEDSLLLDTKSVQQITQLLIKDQSASSTHSRPNRNEFSNSYQMPKNNDRGAITTRVRNSPYTAHLMRVYGFWEVFLPQAISKEYAQRTDETAITQHLLFMEASADAARFKHGFFVMLGLVLLLLTLLCLCVYLLRRDPLSPSPQFDCGL